MKKSQFKKNGIALIKLTMAIAIIGSLSGITTVKADDFHIVSTKTNYINSAKGLIKGESYNISTEVAIKEFKDIQSYRIYYGGGHEQDTLDATANYDAIILDNASYTKDQLQYINSRGTFTLGYQSVFEVPWWDADMVSQMNPDDFICMNGQKVISAEGNYYGDLRSTHYQTLLVNRMNQLSNLGFRGIFIDTAGYIDDWFYDDEQITNDFRTGYVSILQQVKNTNSNLKLVQNWGFSTFQNASAPYIDGVMWENFRYSVASTNPWCQKYIEMFKQYHANQGTVIFTTFSSEGQETIDYSKALGFVPYFNPGNYVEW